MSALLKGETAVRIHAYKVNVSETSVQLEDVLSAIKNESDFRSRIRLINQVELRAESVDQQDGVWLLDFVRIRTSHGPGKVGRDSEVEGFSFEEEEGFGEETAALYDPATGYILVQYNHFGVRFNAIADYLSDYDTVANNLYTFKPKFDEDVERRLLKQGVTRKLAFAIDLSRMSEQDRKRGLPLSEAIELGQKSGADRVRVEISVQGGKDKSLLQSAQETIESLRGIFGQNPEAVKKLEVSGKEDQEAITEVLDLLGHRLSVEINDLVLGDDLRYPRSERWRALLRAKNGWKNILKT